MSRDDPGLVIVTRAPGADAKTRLAAEIGTEPCLRLQRAFLADVLSWGSELVRRPVVSVHPPQSAPDLASELAAAYPLAEIVPQLGQSFGARMRGAVNAGFAKDSPAVAMIATDSPTLPAEQIAAAWSALARSDIVLGPAEDGGWVLIAAREPLPDQCFAGVRWSSRRTAADTRRALERSGLRVELGAPWYDVDEAADLERLACDLRDGAAVRAPATARELRELGFL